MTNFEILCKKCHKFKKGGAGEMVNFMADHKHEVIPKKTDDRGSCE